MTVTGVDSAGSQANRTISFTKTFGTTATVTASLANGTLVVGGTTQASAVHISTPTVLRSAPCEPPTARRVCP